MTVSTAYRTAAYAQDTGIACLVLLMIEHAAIDPPIRVVNNTEDIVSNGETFVGFPFDVILPDEREDSSSRARLTIDNVSQEIAQAIRSISTPPTVTIQVIRSEDPDYIERTDPFYSLRNVRWDAMKVSGDLVLEDFTSEPYPAGVFSPASFPGLFG